MTEENFEYRLIGRMKLHDNEQTMTYGAFVIPQYREGEFLNCGIGTYYRLIITKNIILKFINCYSAQNDYQIPNEKISL